MYFATGRLAAGKGVKRSLIGTVRRRDGRRQITYNGRPLYYYVGDTRAGHEEAYETFTVFLADQKCSKGNNPGAYCSSEIWYSKWDPAAGKFTPIANLSGSSAS